VNEAWRLNECEGIEPKKMENGKFISYAQNYEDVMLWRALKHINRGFYVDVGACDPILHSVTQAFYERGWRGINIEPASSYYERLCAARPFDTNLAVAVADTEGELIFYEIPETGLSTLDIETAQKYRAAGWAVTERKLPVLTLDQILEKHVIGPVHFLKIDVEGSEKKVLYGLNLSRWRPWILVIEATLPNSSDLHFADWEPFVLAADYEMVYSDGLNRFYVAREHAALAEMLKTPPNVFDVFMLYDHKKALDDIKQYEVWLKEAETDRAARLDQVHQYDIWLKESQAELKKFRNSLIYRVGRRLGLF
jgi:FkbM family methyltransferase